MFSNLKVNISDHGEEGNDKLNKTTTATTTTQTRTSFKCGDKNTDTLEMDGVDTDGSVEDDIEEIKYEIKEIVEGYLQADEGKKNIPVVKKLLKGWQTFYFSVSHRECSLYFMAVFWEIYIHPHSCLENCPYSNYRSF